MMTTGDYRFLHKYLDERYADKVVLTFKQIEDLLGFALPAQARTDPAWWTHTAAAAGGPHFSDAWTLAHRTAMPNILARNVVFDRIA